MHVYNFVHHADLNGFTNISRWRELSLVAPEAPAMFHLLETSNCFLQVDYAVHAAILWNLE